MLSEFISCISAKVFVRNITNRELHGLLHSRLCYASVRRVSEACGEANSDFSSLTRSVFLFVEMVSCCMSEKDVMGAKIAANLSSCPYFRRMRPRRISLVAKGRRLVEGYPLFYAVSEGFEEEVGVDYEILDDDGICPAAQILQVLGKIPVVPARNFHKLTKKTILIPLTYIVAMGSMFLASRPSINLL